MEVFVASLVLGHRAAGKLYLKSDACASCVDFTALRKYVYREKDREKKRDDYQNGRRDMRF